MSAPASHPARVDRLAYCCYLLLGAGTIFPWNSLITAADYWEARYPGKHTDRLLTVSYLPINLVVIAAMVRWHGLVRPSLRIMAGLAGFTAAVSAVPLLSLGPPTNASLAVLLLLVAACGICDGLAQGALFGDAAMLPPAYTQALVAGTAVSGVVVCLLRIFTKATLPDTPAGLRASANLYFCIAALVCAACTAVYGYVLPRLPVVRQARQAALEAALQEEKESMLTAAASGGAGRQPHTLHSHHQHHHEEQEQQQQPPWSNHSTEVELSIADQHSQMHLHRHASPQRLQSGWAGLTAAQQQQQQQEEAAAAGEAPLLGQRRHTSSDAFVAGAEGSGVWQRMDGGGSSGGPTGLAGGMPTNAAVFRVIWRLAVSTTLIYCVTLSIFPGVLAEDVQSADLGSWYPVALITAFNVGDWVGKSLPGWNAMRIRNERVILAATGLRILFLPAFHVAAVGGLGPAVIGLLTLLLGASNGYLTAVAMVAAPAAVPPAAAPLAGNQMVLFLILGLCIGAACSFLWLL